MTLKLAITLFGSPSAAIDGAPVRGFVSSKAAALLYYLAATGRPHSREALAALLWPDVDNAQALKNLRDVLSNLRRLLEPYLEISRQRVALVDDGRVEVDSRRFEAEALAGEGGGPAGLRAAVARYAGPFLDGFAPADALPFEEWARAERERLQQLALGALQRLAAHAAHDGAHMLGVDYATRALAIDPLREEAHRQLMELLARSGQRGAALAQYEACRRLLHDELGLDPDEATEELYRRILDGQIAAPAAPALARPLYQLPAPRTAIVGRHAETAQAAGLLTDPAARLLTLTGPGGVGKTTLALHVAHQLAAASQRGECFPHGVVFVALSAVGSGDHGPPTQIVAPLVATQVADSLSLTLTGGAPPERQLAEYLRDKALLLVLDNCEHLAVEELVVALLEQAPRLTILATSRGRLNVGGEQVVELGGLAFPPGETAPGRALDYAAVALFRRSAEATSPRLEWSPATAEATVTICRLVHGLPLAITLAASLARLMPVAEIARELAADLEILATTRRDLPERHRSLRAVFEHSWRLLTAEEQAALSRLSVFQGGFTRDAAARVAGATLPVLAALVDNSLVRRLPGGEGAARYDLLDLVRQFAGERLAAQDGLRAAVSEQHARHYLALLTRCGGELRRGGQREAAAEIAGEIDNVRAGWRWAAEHGRAELLAAAAEPLFRFYEMRGWFREGAELFGRVAAAPWLPAAQGGAELSGRLLAYAGWCTFQLGRQREGREALAASRAALRDAPASAARIPALIYGAACAYYSGDYAEAEGLAGEALALSQELGERHGASVALTVLGQIAALVGDYDEARRASEASLAIEREEGNRWGMVFPLISLGRVAQAQGAHREAQGHFQEGLAIRTAFHDQRGVALCLRSLGDTAVALGDHREARWFYQEALGIFRDLGNEEGAVTALTGLGDVALARGETAQARAAFVEALASARRAGSAPRALDAAAGIAAALAPGNGPGAAGLAALVYRHPAATQACRDRAALLLAQGGRRPPLAAPDLAAPSLDQIILEAERLLAPG